MGRLTFDISDGRFMVTCGRRWEIQRIQPGCQLSFIGKHPTTRDLHHFALLLEPAERIVNDGQFICALRQVEALVCQRSPDIPEPGFAHKKSSPACAGEDCRAMALHGDARNGFAPVGVTGLCQSTSLKDIGRARSQTGNEKWWPDVGNRLARP
jgi:hypothetical protein